ncbi:hypothetical protein OKA06_14855 [Novosphingobium sp. MW5]|nr:hypothetical protein [Novosphingobium sp. MW5]
MLHKIETATVMLIASMAATSPAWAGLAPATPAPVIGLGIPALAAFGLAYKRLRNRNQK